MAEGRLIPLTVNVKRNGEKSLINVTLCEVYIFKLYEFSSSQCNMWRDGCLVNKGHTAREVKQKFFLIVAISLRKLLRLFSD